MIELVDRPREKTLPRTRMRKVYYAYYDYEYGPPHPVIRLGGKYLEAYGFAIGDHIKVTLERHRISITKMAKQP